MSVQNRRLRGRPKGSEKNDNLELAQVADHMIQNPTMKPTTAIKKVIGIDNPSAIRRLQNKFRERRGPLREEAQQRIIWKQEGNRDTRLTIFATLEILQDPPSMEALRRFQELPVVTQIRQLDESLRPLRLQFKAIRKALEQISPTWGPDANLLGAKEIA